jgi:riboflavin synthase
MRTSATASASTVRFMFLSLGRLRRGIDINIGTCLTVTEFNESTNLGSLKTGSIVNLERAVSADTRMGGHFVQGHVDTVATIQSITPDGNALTFRFKPRDPAVLRYIVEKGYVTIDGASLTVTKVQDGPDGWWEVMLIAYTQEKVVTASKQPGEEVNVEVDQVGKYVEKSVAGYFEDSANGEFAILEKMVSRLVEQALAKQRSQ